MIAAVRRFEEERDIAYAQADAYRRRERLATRPRRVAEWRQAAEAAERRGAAYHAWAVEARTSTHPEGA